MEKRFYFSIENSIDRLIFWPKSIIDNLTKLKTQLLNEPGDCLRIETTLDDLEILVDDLADSLKALRKKINSQKK